MRICMVVIIGMHVMNLYATTHWIVCEHFYATNYWIVCGDLYITNYWIVCDGFAWH